MSGLSDFITAKPPSNQALSLADLNAALDAVWASVPDTPTQQWIVSKPAYDRMRAAYHTYLRRHPRVRLGLRITANPRVKR